MVRPARIPFIEAEPADALIDEVRLISSPLVGWEDLDPLMDRIGDARYVLLGEASHGTAEFYNWRRTISQRLIREKGFSFIAVEGDWPDCYRVNRFVKGYAEADRNVRQVLRCFGRWPTWMWANEEIAQLAEWLRGHNQSMAEEHRVGFFGLDVYSLWESMHAILDYLARVDGSAAIAARRAFECFEPYAYDVEEYARSTAWTPASCEIEVVDLLQQLRANAPAYQREGRDDYFDAEQNALVMKNAEMYYRTMVRGDSPSWNIRDKHMAETLNRLMVHHGPEAKAIVWEHNTHIGDARYCDMAATGMVNVGQLIRQQHAEDGVVLVGFSSYRGTVIAGDEWAAPMRVMSVPPGRSGSWEHVLHQSAAADRLLIFDRKRPSHWMLEPRGHRAIGVVYRPRYEAFGNYVPTVLPRRYDALLFIDQMHALHPLEAAGGLEHELPETFPTGV
ncbi:MAG TPA: erythromycin esterase family protein [Lacipirellulaceae bacterium]|nr:erythromycin esterase family protein [Lacipirellulaceae bacterium]